jgi:hypothetical protein
MFKIRLNKLYLKFKDKIIEDIFKIKTILSVMNHLRIFKE